VGLNPCRFSPALRGLSVQPISCADARAHATRPPLPSLPKGDAGRGGLRGREFCEPRPCALVLIRNCRL
jgi:hypothetical protein